MTESVLVAALDKDVPAVKEINRLILKRMFIFQPPSNQITILYNTCYIYLVNIIEIFYRTRHKKSPSHYREGPFWDYLLGIIFYKITTY